MVTLWATCSHRGREPQEVCGIIPAWITDIPSMPMFVTEGTVVVTGGRFVKKNRFFYNACQTLLVDQLGGSGLATGFGKLSTKKTPQTN